MPPAPKPYTATDGTVTYKVRFRFDGKNTSETFETLTQANAFCQMVDDMGAAAAVAQRNAADARSDEYMPTVEEALKRHVRELTGIQSDTREGYLAIARRTWLPMIGRYRVDTVTRAVVSDVVNRLDGRHAPKTIKNAHSVLSATMETALHGGKIEANPCKGVRLPRSGEESADEIRFLTHDEFDLLHDCIREDWRPFVILLFGTGLRFSEATALQVADINPNDADGWTLRVARAWKKGGRIGPPKSRASRRTIVLPPEVVAAIAPRMREKNAAGELVNRPGSAWLFTTETGKPVTHNNFWNRIWRPAVIRASICDDHLDPKCRCINAKHRGCPVHATFEPAKNGKQGAHIVAEPCGCAGTINPRPRIHDARHTHASWMIANGARLEVVQERLGHEDYAITRRVYAHLTPDMRREAALVARGSFQGTRLALATSPAEIAPAP